MERVHALYMHMTTQIDKLNGQMRAGMERVHALYMHITVQIDKWLALADTNVDKDGQTRAAMRAMHALR